VKSIVVQTVLRGDLRKPGRQRSHAAVMIHVEPNSINRLSPSHTLAAASIGRAAGKSVLNAYQGGNGNGNDEDLFHSAAG
jgi:hypothetical protein